MAFRVALLLFSWLAGAFNITDVRPALVNRTFTSLLVDYVVKEVGGSVLPRPLGTLFSNCLPNTLDTTILHASPVPSTTGDRWDTFVITGDIPAMWLRDSMNQVYPYVRLLNASLAAGKWDPQLENVLFGVVHRQAASIVIDSYANAFAWWGPKGSTGQNQGDQTYKEFEFGAGKVSAMQDLRLYERKFEIDSLLSLLKLASALSESTKPGTAEQSFLRDPSFIPAVRKVLDTLEEMQSCDFSSHKNSPLTYTFQRQATEPTDTLSHGVGAPCAATGMVRTHFRPSDDAVIYAFNVPGNAMAAVELQRIRPLLGRLRALYDAAPDNYPWAAGLDEMEQRAAGLEESIRAGIAAHGTMEFHGEEVYAYEVDGFGNAVFMDDANVPSLLSLPFLGFLPASDPLYQATRRLLLGAHNPWYFKGSLGIGGIGGPHVGIGYIWPMSLIIQAMTSDDVEEVSVLLGQLMRSSFPNGLMHESFNRNSLSDFTRRWFAWCNTLFGELVLKVATDPVLYAAANLTEPLDLVALIGKWSESTPAVMI